MTRTALRPRTAPRPRTSLLCGVLLLLALQGLAVGVAPGPLRLFLSGALIGASVAGLLLALLLATSRRRAGGHSPGGDARCAGRGRHPVVQRPLAGGLPDGAGPPAPARPGRPGLNRLYTAWMFAAHGHDPQWISHHLHLPAPTARLLVAATRNPPPYRT